LSLLSRLPFLTEQRCSACGRICRSEPGLPPICDECAHHLARPTTGFCASCGQLFADGYLPVSLCGDCLKNPPPWQGLTFYGEYTGLLRELILRCKFGQDGAAAQLLGHLLGLALLPVLESWTEEARARARIVPMPLHASRLLRRGSNQCVELARALRIPLSGRAPLDLHSLQRIRAGREQRGLSRRERLHNVVRAFAASPGIAGAHVILLDDVLTTGTTLRYAARSLLDAGAARVHCAVMARVRLG
jgi:ComF family protein